MRERLLNRDQLAQLPAPTPFIADTLDCSTVALLVGSFGTMKSFTAQSWAASVATGQPWLGRGVQQRRTLYIAAEGAAGLNERFGAWEHAWRRKIPADQLLTLPGSVNLSNSGHVTDVYREILDEGIGFVVVDTLAKCAVGLDENSAKDMGIVVDALYGLKEATRGGCVAVLHHTGKDKSTTRGSSALEAGVDTVYLAEGDSRYVKLSRTKRKDGPCDDVLQLRLDTSRAVESGWIVSTRPADMSGNEEKLMSAFVSAFSDTGASKADLRNVAGLAPASFARSLNTLVRRGILINQGTDARPFYKTAA